jgi:two-component system, chemotaxis family, protein-glutamate methylesterase/glutaminase
MAPVRVLVVDDSVVVRRLVSDALAADADIEVVGSAANGRIALAKIAQLNPDVVTLDIEMPEMDGLETITEIRKQWTRLPVIMFSTLTERGAAVTLDALALGANDYVTKPSNSGNVTTALQRIREELVPKVHALAGRRPTGVGSTLRTAPPAGARPASPSPVVPRRPSAAPRVPGRVDVVVVAVSTGGPNALAEVVPALPGNLPVPVLVVQHMPPVFTRMLAERLDGKSAISVAEAANGDVPRPGGMWLAPGGSHLVLDKGAAGVRLRLDDGPMENSCKPAADPLYRSVVAAYGGNVLAVVLTGMGQDGLRGAEAVHEAGGQVVAQDEATSVVWGMPGFVVRAGLADAVVPLGGVAAEIARRVAHGRAGVVPTRPTAPIRIGTR